MYRKVYLLRCLLSWDVTPCRVATLVDSIFKGKTWPIKMGQQGCPSTSVPHYHSTLPNIPEVRRSYLNLGGRLKL